MWSNKYNRVSTAAKSMMYASAATTATKQQRLPFANLVGVVGGVVAIGCVIKNRIQQQHQHTTNGSFQLQREAICRVSFNRLYFLIVICLSFFFYADFDRFKFF